MSIDYTKTQVLFPIGLYGGPRYFRRKRVSVLLDRGGRVLREMTCKQWTEFKERWPGEVEKDGLSLRIVWVLKEVQG